MDKKNPKILIIEDEEDILRMYVFYLGNHGFDALAAVDGEEALKVLKDNAGEIDLILLDIIMPKTDGFELLKIIKENKDYRHIPVIINSNLDNAEDKEEALNLGAKDFFIKSNFTPSQLAIKIKSFIA